MTKARKKQGPSLFRRLTYLLVIISGGGAGLGSWAFQDDPRLLALWTLVTGKPAEADKTALDGSLVTEVVDALKPRDSFGQPGVYQVTVAQVQLDQKLFKPGHTVNIQAKVKRLDPEGRDTTLWDAKTFGERLAVVGRDELTAGWPHRPFQVDWTPGDQLVLEVYDAKTNLFAAPTRFTLATTDGSANEFPLKSGDFALELVSKNSSPIDPREPRHSQERAHRQRSLGRFQPNSGRRAPDRHQVRPLGPKERTTCPRVSLSTVLKAKAKRSPSSSTTKVRSSIYPSRSYRPRPRSETC